MPSRDVWLTPYTRIHTKQGPMLVSDMATKQSEWQVIDDFGDEFTVSVAAEPEDKMPVLITANSGETFSVGADSVVNVVVDGKARLVPTLAAQLVPGAFLFLPKRKIRLSPGAVGDEMAGLQWECTGTPANETALLCEAAEVTRAAFLGKSIDHKKPEYKGDFGGLILEAESVDQLRLQLQLAGFYGMSLRRAPGELKLYLEAGRPSCYPSKVTAGIFCADKAVALGVVEDFYGRGIFTAAHKITDRFLDKVWRTGVIFEGQPVDNVNRLNHISVGLRSTKMHRVTAETEDTPIELTYANI